MARSAATLGSRSANTASATGLPGIITATTARTVQAVALVPEPEPEPQPDVGFVLT